MAEPEFVDLRTFHDMHELEEVLAVLQSEGIPAHAPGRSVAGLFPGAGEALFQVPLRVPSDRADEARALIEAFLTAEPEYIDFPDGVDFPNGSSPGGGPAERQGEGGFGPVQLVIIAGSIGAVLWMLLRGQG